MKRTLIALAALVLAAFPAAHADETAPETTKSPEELRAVSARLARQFASGVVRVDIYFTINDQGGYTENVARYFCQGCRNYHSSSSERMVLENRPMSLPGYLVAPDTVIFSSIIASTNGIREFRVGLPGGETVSAELDAVYPVQSATRLKLAAPLPGGEPVRFTAADAGAELFSLFISDEDGKTTATVAPFAPTRLVYNLDNGETDVALPENTLIVNAAGEVLTIATKKSSPLDQWSLPPDRWTAVPVAELVRAAERLQKSLAQNTVLVKIKVAERPDNASVTASTHETVGFLLPDGNIALPESGFNYATVSRIETITVITPDEVIPAEFVGAHQDLQLLIIRPEQALAAAGLTPAAPADGKKEDRLYWAAIIQPLQDEFIITPHPAFCDGNVRGRNNQLFPNFSSSASSRAETPIFTLDGELFAVPLTFRSQGEQSGSTYYIPIADLMPILNNFNPLYSPKGGDDRFSMGWIGVEIQELDQELARANRVLHLTDNGDKGAMIATVIAGSPAAAAGLEPGDVILYIASKRDGIPVSLNRYSYYSNNYYGGDFPWAQYDDLSDMYFDHIPAPWPSQNTALNRLVTEFGIGSQYLLAYARDGKIIEAELTVEAAPENFATVKRLSSKALGMAVCNMTPEVRNYIQLGGDAPGVVVATVSTGGKAAVAGIKPYELITKIDDVPVYSIAEFKEMTSGRSEFKFEIKRMAASRIVGIKLDAPLDYPAE